MLIFDVTRLLIGISIYLSKGVLSAGNLLVDILNCFKSLFVGCLLCVLVCPATCCAYTGAFTKCLHCESFDKKIISNVCMMIRKIIEELHQSNKLENHIPFL